MSSSPPPSFPPPSSPLEEASVEEADHLSEGEYDLDGDPVERCCKSRCGTLNKTEKEFVETVCKMLKPPADAKKQKQFWFDPAEMYGTVSSSTSMRAKPIPPCPEAYFLKKVFVWDPMSQFEGVTFKCPECGRTLTRSGWFNQYVHGVHRGFIFLQKRLECRSKLHTRRVYNSADVQLHRQLPPHLQRRLPIIDTKKVPNGVVISSKLSRRIMADLELSGFSIAAVRRSMADRRIAYHARRVREYLEDVHTYNEFQRNQSKPGAQSTLTSERASPLLSQGDIVIPPMSHHCGLYNEPLAFSESVFSNNFLHSHFGVCEKLADLHMSHLPISDVVCSDVCNNVGMSVRSRNPQTNRIESASKGLYGVMNMFSQFIAYNFLYNENNEEMAHLATQVFTRCVRDGKPVPAAWCVDKCCGIPGAEGDSITFQFDLVHYLCSEGGPLGKELPEGVSVGEVFNRETKVTLDLFHCAKRIADAVPKKAKTRPWFQKEIYKAITKSNDSTDEVNRRIKDPDLIESRVEKVLNQVRPQSVIDGTITHSVSFFSLLFSFIYILSNQLPLVIILLTL